MHNPKHQNNTTMETKSVDQLKKELAEAEAREQGLMNAPYVGVFYFGKLTKAYKKRKAEYMCVIISGLIVADQKLKPITIYDWEQYKEITADEFNAAYDAAMAKIKEAKDE